MKLPETEHIFVDREEERKFFADLLSPTPEKRAAFFHAKGRKGKTHLLRELRRQAQAANVQHIYLEFRGAPSLRSIFSVFEIRLGDRVLERFHRSLRIESGSLDADLSSAQVGDNSTINIFNNQGDIASEVRSIALANDLKNCKEKLIIFIDVYDEGKTLAGLVELFLHACCCNENLCIIIAGQSVPDHDNGTWNGQVRLFEVSGITDHQHWVKLAHDLEPRLTGNFLDSQIREMCHYLEGDPAAMVSVVLGMIAAFRKDNGYI